MSKWQTDSEGFKEAIQSNEYAEYVLSDQFTVVKDVDSPLYVVGTNVENPEGSEEQIEDLLIEQLSIYKYAFLDEENSEAQKEGCYLYDLQ